MKTIIKKLNKIITNYEYDEGTVKIIQYKYPNEEQIMDKINEIIDYINKKENAK